MKRMTYTVLAAAVASFSGAAGAQQACQSDIQQLQSQLQQRQISGQTRQEIEQLLSRARSADAETCDGFVAAARQRLTEAQTASSQQSAQARQQQGQQAAQAESSRQQDRTTDVQVRQPPANVAVDAGAPEVDVQQQPPQVTVEQRPPEVTITQPEPEVTVQQAEPQVSVEQGQPDVQVQQAEPQVRVQQGGDPEVRVVEPESERQAQARSGEQAQQARQPAGGGAIDETQVSELVGNSIRTAEGEEVGEVSAIARSRADSELYAVADVGGFFGIGERTVAVPLERASIDEDGNVVTQMSREELEQMREYDPQQFAAVR